MTNNKCNAYCRLRPGLDYVLFDSIFEGQETEFYSGIVYRVDFGYDTPIAGVREFVFVKNGHKTVCLDEKEFKQHFVLIKKLS